MNWYHRLERRYVEYGSSFEATRAFGLFRALYDIVYNMNLAHLSPEVETVFERSTTPGVRTACTPFLIYRGRHRHEVGLEGCCAGRSTRRRLKFRHAAWGPDELFYGELYASRRVPCKPTSLARHPRRVLGLRRARSWSRDGLYDFLLFSLPDNDNHSHRHGPEASRRRRSPRPTAASRKLVEAAGGMDGFLADHAVILLADHAQTEVDRELPIVERARASDWRVLQPSEDRPRGGASSRSARPSRAAHVYLLEVEDAATPSTTSVREALGAMEGVDLVCWLAGARRPRRWRAAGPVPAGAGPRRWSSAAARELRFRPGGAGRRPGAAAAGTLSGDLGVARRRRSRTACCAASAIRIRSPASGRRSARRTPATCSSPPRSATSASTGAASAHVGGGSHGSLHARRLARPAAVRRLRARATPTSASSGRCATSPPIVLEHFGLAPEPARERTAQGAAR